MINERAHAVDFIPIAQHCQRVLARQLVPSAKVVLNFEPVSVNCSTGI